MSQSGISPRVKQLFKTRSSEAMTNLDYTAWLANSNISAGGLLAGKEYERTPKNEAHRIVWDRIYHCRWQKSWNKCQPLYLHSSTFKQSGQHSDITTSAFGASGAGGEEYHMYSCFMALSRIITRRLWYRAFLDHPMFVFVPTAVKHTPLYLLMEHTPWLNRVIPPV